MKLFIDTSFMEAQVCGSFEPRLDKDGVQRRDKSGGTNLPLWAVKLVAWFDEDAETILVTVAAAEPPKVVKGQYVSVHRLEAMPWVQNGNSRVAFRAASILPVTNSTTSGAKPASAPAAANN